MKGKNETLKLEGDVVGLAKSITIKKGEDFYKLTIWIQREGIPVNETKNVLDEIEEIIDLKMNETIKRDIGVVEKVEKKEITSQKMDVDVW
jgi:hypothetical protein